MPKDSKAVDFGKPHRRLNALTGRWVQVSPQRMGRPWQGEEHESDPPAPAYDPACYLCPGNTRVGGEANPQYEGVYVFDNDFPALTDDEDSVYPNARKDPLFGATQSHGRCRVICFSPDHSKTLPELSPAEIRNVIDCWAELTEGLGRRFACVQLFENKGAMMGCSNPHPHGQVWATGHITQEVWIEHANQKGYFDGHGRPMLLDVAVREIEEQERVVELTDHWLAVVPYWAEWPFELLVLPRFKVERMPDLAPAHRDDLAVILKSVTTRYDNLFHTSFPYSMGWHGAPHWDEPSDCWQLHAHFYPPLLRSASVRKFMVGYEMLAEAQRDITPERAAEMLRAVSGTVHYREAQ